MAATTAVGGYVEYERARSTTTKTTTDYHRSTTGRTTTEYHRSSTVVPHKDYSRPLHVDCSVEYELPNAAKPPAGARNEPLLMIHPCYYRRAESQRRSPFVNNLPSPNPATHYPTQVRYPDPRIPSDHPNHRIAPDPRLIPDLRIATAVNPKLCSSVDSGRWTPLDPSRLPAPGNVVDSGGVPTPCGIGAAPAAPAPIDDKINLPDVLDEIRLLVSEVHPINQTRAALCQRATCGPQASYLWCPILRKQSRKSLYKSWDHSVKCSTVQT